MIKEKKWNTYALIGTASVSALTYLLFKVKCFGSCDTEIIKPFFMATLGLIPTMIFLLFFSNKIFISWFKHIGWWFLLGVTYIIFFVSSENESFLSPSRVQVILFLMIGLFIITIIYALVMNWKLKKNA